jgi:hypothetical protein
VAVSSRRPEVAVRLLASSFAEPGDRASRTSGSGVHTVALLLARGEH